MACVSACSMRAMMPRRVTVGSRIQTPGHIRLQHVGVGPVRAGHIRRVTTCSQGGTLQRVARIVVDSTKGLVDAGASLVPSSVPRFYAKIGVASVGGLVALTLLKSIFNTLATLLLIAAAAAFFFARGAAKDGPGKSAGDSGSGGGGGGSDDPLDEARKIMDKYK